MTRSNLSKLYISRSDDRITDDQASVGAYSRWLETDNKRLRIVTYPKDYKADHVCYDGHSFYIIEGRIQIELGEETVEWKTGDAFIIPDNVPHRVFNPFYSDAKVVVSDYG